MKEFRGRTGEPNTKPNKQHKKHRIKTQAKTNKQAPWLKHCGPQCNIRMASAIFEWRHPKTANETSCTKQVPSSNCRRNILSQETHTASESPERRTPKLHLFVVMGCKSKTGWTKPAIFFLQLFQKKIAKIL